MSNKADEALKRAKEEAEAVQTAAASAAVNTAAVAQPKNDPPKPAPKVAAPPPKPAAKPKQSIVQIKFNEGMRDVEVEFIKDEGTMTPRKIEHAMRVLQKKYREHLGKALAAEARKQRTLEKTDATK